MTESLAKKLLFKQKKSLDLFSFIFQQSIDVFKLLFSLQKLTKWRQYTANFYSKMKYKIFYFKVVVARSPGTSRRSRS